MSSKYTVPQVVKAVMACAAKPWCEANPKIAHHCGYKTRSVVHISTHEKIDGNG